MLQILQAICKTVREIVKPIIAEQIPKYKIDSVEFEALTLGSLPLTFQGSICSLSHTRTHTNDFIALSVCLFYPIRMRKVRKTYVQVILKYETVIVKLNFLKLE